MAIYYNNYSLIDYLAMICFISFLGFCQENIWMNSLSVYWQRLVKMLLRFCYPLESNIDT